MCEIVIDAQAIAEKVAREILTNEMEEFFTDKYHPQWPAKRATTATMELVGKEIKQIIHENKETIIQEAVRQMSWIGRDRLRKDIKQRLSEEEEEYALAKYILSR